MRKNIPQTMAAVLLTGHGGLEKLEYREDINVPVPKDNQVLIRVGAAAINNTDINTRIAWYSKSVTSATNAGGGDGFGVADDADGSWSGGALEFPRIQGADCCGTIVAVGGNVDPARMGERVLVRAMQQAEADSQPYQCHTFGSEYDGAFAQFAVTFDREAYAVNSDWSDVELASIPCAYSTAENLLHRADVGEERVLVTGASGGVGSAAVQLAKRRQAEVIALVGPGKQRALKDLGADTVLNRDADLVEILGTESIDVVIDLVAGTSWPTLLDVLKKGGRYATAGAIAGPIVELDVRTLYLKDLTLLGATFQEAEVFDNLIRYIERNELQPMVAKTYPLAEIRQAQREFLRKEFVGKLVLIPPA